MITLLNNKVYKIYENYVRSMHTRINVSAGLCRYNFRCHRNAVHDAIESGHSRLIMTVYIDSGVPIIHFINEANGVYVDNTLGHWSSQYDYYFIRVISRDEFWNIEQIFTNYRKWLRSMFPWWVRLFSDFDA